MVQALKIEHKTNSKTHRMQIDNGKVKPVLSYVSNARSDAYRQ